MRTQILLLVIGVGVFSAACGFHAEGASITIPPAGDAALTQGTVVSAGSSPNLSAGADSGGVTSRAVLWFDLASQIPTGSKIRSVALTLELTDAPVGGANSLFSLRRCLVGWNELSVTWTNLTTDAVWSVPGGAAGTDFSATPSSSVFLSTVGSYTFGTSAQMVADAQAFLDAPAANFGWVLKCESEGTAGTLKQFASREALDLATQPMLTVTYDPPLPPEFTVSIPASADASLFEDTQRAHGTPQGNWDSIYAGANQKVLGSRAVLKFDVAAAIPAGATIRSVTLRVAATRSSLGGARNSVFAVHRVAAAWDEMAVTWAARTAGANWSAPGAASPADFASTPSSVVFISVNGGYVFPSSQQLVAEVQSFLDSPSGNFGWLLRSQSEATSATARQFGSRENAASANRPALVVAYDLPPTLTVLPVANREFRLSFSAGANRTYVVETRDSLGGGAWGSAQSIGPFPSQTTAFFTNSIDAPTRFFRVRTP